jgi:hypothetical protein
MWERKRPAKADVNWAARNDACARKFVIAKINGILERRIKWGIKGEHQPMCPPRESRGESTRGYRVIASANIQDNRFRRSGRFRANCLSSIASTVSPPGRFQ